MNGAKKLRKHLNNACPTKNRSGLTHYNGLSPLPRDWERGLVEILRPAMIDKLLDHFDITSSSPLPASCSTPLGARGPEEKSFEGRYREAVRSLLQIAVMSRPDTSNAVEQVAPYTRNRTARHWEAVRKILSNMKSTNELGIIS